MFKQKIFRVGIAGLGRAGWRQHFQPLLHRPGFRITGVVDPMAERTSEAVAAAVGCVAFPSLDAMLQGSAPDLVVIATPSCSHFEEAGKVLAQGVHCILEKPMTVHAWEATRLLAEAQQSGRYLFVHHQHAFTRESEVIRSVIESGRLGRLFHVKGYWAGFNRRRDWQSLKKNGGGQLRNTFPHLLSVVMECLGKPLEASYASLKNIKDAGDAEDYAHALFHTDDGITVDLTATNAAALPGLRWTLLGSHGSFQSDGIKGHLRYYARETAPPLPVIDGAAPERKYMLEELTWRDEYFDLEAEQVRSFYDNVEEVLFHGLPMKVAPESACEIMGLLEAIERLAAPMALGIAPLGQFRDGGGEVARFDRLG